MFRGRALVEERIKESKCGMALRHLPSGFASVNAVWTFAAFLAVNLSVFCQSLGEVDSSGRAHAKRARRELFCVPARVLFRGRRLVLRLAPGHRRGSFLSAWERLRALLVLGSLRTGSPPAGTSSRPSLENRRWVRVTRPGSLSHRGVA